jgi:hypothetical protein
LEESEAHPTSIWPDLLGGAGLGLLLGTLVGLSSSPVVGVVVGALASVLAVFLGLDLSTGSVMGALRINGPRIGALGLATVVGVGIGLWVRVNNPFLPDPLAQLQRWQAALPEDPTLAKQMMLFERTGIVPSRFQYGNAPPGEDVTVAMEEGAAIRTAVLFSTLSEFDACTQLDPASYRTADAVLARYSRPGAPDYLPKFAASITALPEADRNDALATAHQLLCIMQGVEVE